jgi:hypothetical protein
VSGAIFGVATVLDLEREIPKIRAFALQRWKAALAAPKVTTTRGYLWSDEVDTFWDWALLELLVQSGLRIEEASELTTLDILKRKNARRPHLLPPADQAIEVWSRSRHSHRRRARPCPGRDHPIRKMLLQQRVGPGL